MSQKLNPNKCLRQSNAKSEPECTKPKTREPSGARQGDNHQTKKGAGAKARGHKTDQSTPRQTQKKRGRDTPRRGQPDTTDQTPPPPSASEANSHLGKPKHQKRVSLK